MKIPAIMLFIFLALVVSAVGRAGTTYEWRDEYGVAHFTDNADRIPERYTNAVKEHSSPSLETKRQAPTDTAAPPTVLPPRPTDLAARPTVNSTDHARLSQELETLQEELLQKKKDLARLHHKWTVVKGRVPTPEELKDFQKKQAQGKAAFEDNPYINKKPLSTPGLARQAYYKKLEEIRNDEERVRQLQKVLQGLRLGVKATGELVERK